LEEEGVFAFALIREETALDFLSCKLIAEDEVTIWFSSGKVELGVCFARVAYFGLIVAGAGEGLDRERTREREAERETSGSSLAFV